MTVPRVPTYGTVVVKALADLPARMLGGTGIQVNVQGFDYRIDLDIEELQVSPIGAANGKWTAVWDEVDSTYKRIQFTELPAPSLDWVVITGKPATFPPTLPIPISGVTNLQPSLDAKLNDDAPLDGHTYGRKNGAWADVAAGVSITVNWTDIVGKPSTFPPSPHSHPESDVTGLVADLAARELVANKAMADGYASLDSGGKVPVAQLPAAATVPGEAPTDGASYARRGSDASWQSVTGTFVGKTSTTGAAAMPLGTTAQRPSPASGYLRFNTETLTFEGYNGSTWSGIGGGVYVGVAFPGSPRQGDLCWRSDLGLMFLFYDDGTSQQWVVTQPAVDTAALDTRYKQITDGGLFKIASGAPAIGATYDIPFPDSANWPGGFELLLSNIAPQAATDTLIMRMSNDGVTFGNASQYRYTALTYNDSGGVPGAGFNSTAQTYIALTGTITNTAGFKSGYRLFFPWTESAAGMQQNVLFDGWYYNGTNIVMARGLAMNSSTASQGMPKAVRIMLNSLGNFQAGFRWQLNGFK